MGFDAMASFALSRAGCAYVYGCTGKPCTPAQRLVQSRQYPSSAQAIRDNCPVLSGRTLSCSSCRHHGKPAYDCAQLVRFTLREGGFKPPSGASSLWHARHLWQARMPFSPGYAQEHFCILFRRDQSGTADRVIMAHTGVCLGDGRVIDARSHRRGVVLSAPGDYPWSDMAIPPDPWAGTESNALKQAGKATDERLPAGLAILSPGSKGEPVRALQARLMALGFPLPRYGADGIFGRETQAALKAFQYAHSLAPTGTADRSTLALLLPSPLAASNRSYGGN